MMRKRLSPLTSAAETKSFSRSESVCERKTRAPHDQPVTASTKNEVQRSAAAEEADQDDEQRQAGNDQEDIGEEREKVVDLAAEVARGHPDEGDDTVVRMPTTTPTPRLCRAPQTV